MFTSFSCVVDVVVWVLVMGSRLCVNSSKYFNPDRNSHIYQHDDFCQLVFQMRGCLDQRAFSLNGNATFEFAHGVTLTKP